LTAYRRSTIAVTGAPIPGEHENPDEKTARDGYAGQRMERFLPTYIDLGLQSLRNQRSWILP
jgi:hypothetical protein